MAFVSRAQERKYKQLLAQGLITEEQYADKAKDTPDDLPEYAGYRPKIRRGPNKYRHVVKEEKLHGQ